jgi:hypothetical protein
MRAAYDALCAGRFGVIDVPCPECGPLRRTVKNQRRKVLRVWRGEPGFATYCCARCGAHGFVRDGAAPADPARKRQADAAERDHKAKRRDLARWLWQRRQPIAGSIAEIYLRGARGYGGPLPATLGFLPANGEHPPSMIAAFGMATEREPGVLAIADDAIAGVHLIKLRSDGSDRLRDHDLADDEPAKITIGRDFVAPIVLAAPNDLLALTIAEGIEDALNDHQATGRGAWAAGSASRMPALADIISGHIECVIVLVDANKAGRDGSTGLAARLYARGIQALLTPVGKAVTP